jgi:hypothetical protein
VLIVRSGFVIATCPKTSKTPKNTNKATNHLVVLFLQFLKINQLGLKQ